MSDDNTKCIIMKFNKDLELEGVWHEYKDNQGNDKKDKIKEKKGKKFKIEFDEVKATSNLTLMKGDIAGVDPYCIIYKGKLYCFP
jgi:hypothetical protein